MLRVTYSVLQILTRSVSFLFIFFHFCSCGLDHGGPGVEVPRRTVRRDRTVRWRPRPHGRIRQHDHAAACGVFA